MAKTEQAEKLYDVVIFEYRSGKVDTIAGRSMRRETGTHNAERRIETVLPRLNGNYGAAIVDAGKYKVGDVLNESA